MNVLECLGYALGDVSVPITLGAGQRGNGTSGSRTEVPPRPVEVEAVHDRGTPWQPCIAIYTTKVFLTLCNTLHLRYVAIQSYQPSSTI